MEKFIRKGRHVEGVECTVCMSFISISHGGISDIKDHLKSRKHICNISTASSSQTADSFFIKPSSDDEYKINAAELANNAYHTIKHHYTFRSTDCNNKLIKVLYPDSVIASKFSSARTKTTALIKTIIAPHSLQNVNNIIEKNNFYGFATDAGNHKSTKIFPFGIRYFDMVKGIQFKLLRVTSLPNETVETITNFCIDTLKEFKLDISKCVAFCGDNTNTNFGGIRRKGTCNIYCKLKQINENIEGIGCPAHIMHNTIQTAADRLSCDIEVVVVKIFTYFSIYTVRTERLKEFCDFVGVQYQNVLSHSGTRWLSLLPAVERILKMFEGLKCFFLSEQKAPKTLLTFSNNPLSEAYLWFIHSQLHVFEKEIKKIEGNKKCCIEVFSILEETLTIIKERSDECFLTISVKNVLREKKDELSQSMLSNYKREIDDFYKTAYEYLFMWRETNASVSVFSWMLLLEIPVWKKVETTCLYLKERGVNLDDSLLFNQMSNVKKIMGEKSAEWKNENMLCYEKWVDFFKYSEHAEEYSEILKICQYMFSIPPHNANIERIFFSNEYTVDRRAKSIGHFHRRVNSSGTDEL